MKKIETHDALPRGVTRGLLASNLKKLRTIRGMSQEDLALEANLHRTFVAHVERGVRNISVDNIEKLAIALNVPAYKLLMDDSAVSLNLAACRA